ncbi:S8 family peptidase [Clostridium sp. HBUAS56010]|uniref:S8 family peptidase n=1 Tax=Clostridium sp. HBUAS56010 TaxID=2571127 RepID=UPI001177E806|nr:S8 family peptidase [Clostridium sp. HBUAS56010]
MKKILDDNYYDLIINNSLIPEFSSGDNITWLNTDYSLLHITRADKQPCDLGFYPYYVFSSLYTPTSVITPDAQPVQGTRQPDHFPLMGQGVLIGIVDTGVDYRHSAFLNRDRTTRIISIWDQTTQTGAPPNGFTFGTEYTRPVINDALRYAEPLSVLPFTDLTGHGTAIASIIAGSPNENQSFSGVVPNSELVIVKLKEAKNNLKMIFKVPEDKLCYQESDIILGVRYLISVGQRLKRPIVICLAMGSNQGSHDGRSALSTFLENVVQIPDIGIVISAGNQGNTNRHYFGQNYFSPHVKDFQLNISPEDSMFSMEIWPHVPGRLSIEVTAPNGELISQINPSFDACEQYTLQSSDSILWINNMAFERGTGDQLILIRFQKPLSGIWNFHLESTDDEPFSIHSWLPGGDLISEGTFFLLPNPDTTITAPGNAWHPLTVTAYNQLTENILDSSGRGYTRSGIVKPNVAAPGYEILCALPGNQYGKLTGTGAAAAGAAGACAIVFEWTQGKGNFTYIAGDQINLMLMRAARRPPSYNYPNNIWGYGIVDVYKLLDRLSSDR